MPVRSLTSFVLRWPERAFVLERLEQWAAEERKRHPRLNALGCFRSYARGDAGVGSELDLVAIVAGSEVPFERRALEWDLSGLPLPAEILVYTEQGWQDLRTGEGRFAHMIKTETVWLQEPAER